MAADEVPVLRTERLLMRPWRETDVPEYARMLRDPDVMRYLGSGPRYRVKRGVASVLSRFSDLETRRMLAEMDRQWRRDRFGLWTLEERSTGAVVGNAGLTRLSHWHADSSDIEIGWLLARASWGKGLGAEAGWATLSFAFDHLQLPRVVGVALTGNLRSVHLMERLHMTCVGRTHWKRNDVIWYAIDRDDWARLQRSP
jgi:RimJ/RimL family protein N-acetyltransferase